MDVNTYALRLMAEHAIAAQEQAERAVIESVREGLISTTEAASILHTSRTQIHRMLNR